MRTIKHFEQKKFHKEHLITIYNKGSSYSATNNIDTVTAAKLCATFVLGRDVYNP